MPEPPSCTVNDTAVSPPTTASVPGFAGIRWPRARRWRVPPRRVLVWSVVSAVPMAMVIAIGAYLSHHLHQQLIESRYRVDYTYQVLGEVDRLFISLQDAETGQRGFVITGDEEYLTPYGNAIGSAPLAFARLRELLIGSAIQAAQMDRLQALMDAKLEEMGKAVAARRTSGFPAAAAVIATGKGKKLMDAVREEVAQIVATENRLLRERQQVAQQRERELLYTGLYVALLSILIRLGLAVTLMQLRKRGKAPVGAGLTER